jgi:hypothetical protein
MRTPRTLDAERLLLRDRAGRVRAKLEVEDGSRFAQLALFDGNSLEIATLWVSEDGKAGLILDEHDRTARRAMTEITPRALRVGLVGQNYVAIQTDPPGDPTLKIVGERSEAVLGQTKLQQVRTGGAEIRPAASLIFFDKDGKVTWSAP